MLQLVTLPRAVSVWMVSYSPSRKMPGKNTNSVLQQEDERSGAMGGQVVCKRRSDELQEQMTLNQVGGSMPVGRRERRE